MLGDVKLELASAPGILYKDEGVPLRATFIVEAEGGFVSVNDVSAVARLGATRARCALRSCQLCPCEWRKGEPTLALA
jgi:lipoyl-dependent peroxiredoxin subunit C